MLRYRIIQSEYAVFFVRNYKKVQSKEGIEWIKSYLERRKESYIDIIRVKRR